MLNSERQEISVMAWLTMVPAAATEEEMVEARHRKLQAPYHMRETAFRLGRTTVLLY